MHPRRPDRVTLDLDARRDRTRLNDAQRPVARERPLDVLRSTKLALERQAGSVQRCHDRRAKFERRTRRVGGVGQVVCRNRRAIDRETTRVDLTGHQSIGKARREFDEHRPACRRREQHARGGRVDLL